MTKTEREAGYEILRRRAREHLLDFILWTWQRPEDFKVGRHTRAFCEWFDKAVGRWEKGVSSYCLFNCPPRHGKSELCNYAAAYFFGRASEWEPSEIYTGYGASLVQKFSKNIQSIIQSEAFSQLFPSVKLSKNDRSVDSWSIEGSHGAFTATGLGGALTGKGGHLLFLDDYCKSSEEAESETYREKTWQAFATDLFTRQMAPASIVVVTATPWHMDDVTCRIRKKMAEDKSFPHFDELCFPAVDKDTGAVLFPELYDSSWYEGQRATNGAQRWAALFLCNPVGDGVRLFQPDWFQTYGTTPTATANFIFCDTAGSKKKRGNDYLVMWVVGVGRDGNYYVLDGVRDKLNLSERADAFFRLVEKWHPHMTYWEQVGAQTDLEFIKLEMDRRGWRTPVSEIAQHVPKEGRILWLQPLFEQGRIWFPPKLLYCKADGGYVDLVSAFREDEFLVFPSVAHDDMLDCLANIRHPDVAMRLDSVARQSLYQANYRGGAKKAENYRQSRLAQILRGLYH